MREPDDESPMIFTFTAVQVVNQFLEVFAMPQSTKRILAISELFSSNAQMLSLKNAQKIYLDGVEKISNSFLLAEPTNATLSKRVFFDTAMAPIAQGVTIAELQEEPDESALKRTNNTISFCLDFHRAGMSPGLGDLSKPTVLLYRCNAEHITTVWGMVDKEGLAESKADESWDLNRLQHTTAWKLAIAHVLVDTPSVLQEMGEDSGEKKDTSRIHFHNYDKIDVWG